MPKDPHTHHGLRKGTKSCVDCRQRKIRCIWPSDAADKCRNCELRGCPCVSQHELERHPDALRLTSRDRIQNVEDRVANLWAYVRRLEARLNLSPEDADVVLARGPALVGEGDAIDEPSEASGQSPVNPPTHLHQLFANELLDSQTPADVGQGEFHPSDMLVVRARKRLQSLVPAREDMAIIVRYARIWLNWHFSILPAVQAATSPDDLMPLYDRAAASDARPNTVASLLLLVAITALQVPPETRLRSPSGVRDGPTFVKEVADVVEEVVTSNELFVASVEGLEVALLLTRMQLVHIRVRKAWLMLRRVIALAEMIGLPRAALRATTSAQANPSDNADAAYTKAAAMWQSICAIDRVVSMMFSLPVGTANYTLDLATPVIQDGKVSPPAFFRRLADIAARITQLDDLVSAGRPISEFFDKILKSDQELRTLASLPPKSWWDIRDAEFTVDNLLQYWYQYIRMRTHIHLALNGSKNGDYAYSVMAATEASLIQVSRYAVLRPNMPTAFFMNRIFDLQVITPAMYLLLSGHTNTAQSAGQSAWLDNQSPKELVQRVADAMGLVSHQPGGDFARDGRAAIQSLMALLSENSASTSDTLTLRIPLLGKIHVRRRPTSAAAPFEQLPPSVSRTSRPQDGWPMTGFEGAQPITPASGPIDQDTGSGDNFSWLMEVTDDFSFFNDDAFKIDQWMSFTGMDAI